MLNLSSTANWPVFHDVYAISEQHLTRNFFVFTYLLYENIE